jgi:iron complex outermembrane receptor protein
MKGLLWILPLLYSLNTTGQDSTLQNITLPEFNVVELRQEQDPLLEYFSANRFSLTENVMSRIPAISLVSRGNFGPEPIFRGFSGGQVNLTIDGMHIFGACTDKMDPVTSYVESNNLCKIMAGNEVSMSSNTGLGASIDLQTNNPSIQDKSFYGQVSSGFNSVSKGFNSALTLGFNDRYFSGIINATFRTNDNYKDGKGEVVDYTQFSKSNFSAKIISNFSQVHRFKVNFIYDRAWNVGYAALPMDVSLAQAKIYNLIYERYFFNSKLKMLEINVYGNNIYHEMDDSQRPDVAIRMDMPGWSNTYGSYLNLNWRAMNGHHISLKGDAFIHNARAEMTMYPAAEDDVPMFMLTWPNIQRYDLGVFAADQWHISEKFELNYSVRFDYGNTQLTNEFAKNHFRIFGYDVDEPIQQNIWNVLIEPNWTINKTWDIGLIGALKQRLPTISELFGFYLFNAQDGYDYIGNPTLIPESALQGEAHINYNKKSFNISLAAFYYHLDNYIVGVVDHLLNVMTIGANGVKVYESLDHAYMTGFELSSLINKEKFSWANVAKFTYGKDSNGEILPQLPPLKISSTFTIKAKNWDLIPEVVGAIQKKNVRPSFGELPSPAWMIANIRASYYLNKKTNWVFQAGIENLFDNYYYEFLDWGQIPRQGINFYVNATFKF